MKKSVPFTSFSNEELMENPHVGKEAICPHCSEAHEVKYGEKVLPDGTKVPFEGLAYVKCDKNGNTYLVGLMGHQIAKR